jgi:hypothetical protein
MDPLDSFSMCATSSEPVLHALGTNACEMRAQLGWLSHVHMDAGAWFALIPERLVIGSTQI